MLLDGEGLMHVESFIVRMGDVSHPMVLGTCNRGVDKHGGNVAVGPSSHRNQALAGGGDQLREKGAKVASACMSSEGRKRGTPISH